MKAILTSLVLAAVSLAGCQSNQFTEPMVLGGITVQPDVLNRGRVLYVRYCMQCHGGDGKANTAEATRLNPPPRDFTAGDFRRMELIDGVPPDSELKRVIQNGIPNTGMPAWGQLEGSDLDALVHYLKTFSNRWQPASASGVKSASDSK